jgi:hypothetical protein
MKIEPSEAESALAAVRAADAQMRRALNAYGAAYHFIVWGVIWLIGFFDFQFRNSVAAGGCNVVLARAECHRDGLFVDHRNPDGPDLP